MIWSKSELVKDLQKKSNHKSIWKIAAPMLLSNITVPLVGLVDSAVMGHLSESYYLAAVGLAAALFTFIIWTMGFLRMITTGLVAQAFGQKDPVLIRQWLYLPAILGLAISLLTLVLNPWLIDVILWWIEGTEQVETKVLEYWNIRIIGLPITLLNAVLLGWFLGMQNARIPLLIVLIINLSNVILDLFLVNVYGMDVDGVAIASVISEGLGLIVGLSFLSRSLRRFPLLRKFEFAWNKIRYLLSLNGDLLLRTLALELVFFTIHSRGAELGDNFMAINAILLNLLMVIANGLDGLANAVEALVGKAIGEKRWRKFRAAVVVGGIWSLVISMIFTLAFALFIDVFINWITDINSVVIEAQPYLIYIVFVPLLSFASFWLDGVFIGASQIKSMRNSMLIAVGLGFIPMYYLLKSYNNHGVWLAYFSFMLLRAWFSWYLLNKGIKKGDYISKEILLDEGIIKREILGK